ncbi:MAG: sporulation initiation factor Spo0A C-terminal domain-containing protein [Oscillospiraceae bacterium]|jgi:two-component system response regulator (stage 0 sporulation protein A)|nr:sporulation initiation factor Spo0A C-terminal domain-containing protein [Oscillospiraceae bacterium]
MRYASRRRGGSFKVTGVLIREEERRIAEQHVVEVIFAFGIPASVKGYHYLREGIIYAVLNPLPLDSLTKQLYPYLGRLFHKTGSSIESSIRRAIEYLPARADEEILRSYFGVEYAYNEFWRPSNSEFISVVSEKVRVDLGRMAMWRM